MKDIADGSIDLILADLPYGITANLWDTVIPTDKLWKEYERIIKEHGCIVLFGQEPFSSKLRLSNSKLYRYDWIWVKTQAGGFLNAHKMPLRTHEKISVFYKRLPKYNPQMRKGFKKYSCKNYTNSTNYKLKSTRPVGISKSNGERYPVDVITFSKDGANRLHPTQKPVELLKYIIKTYTDEGDIVLDNVMGSGSTGVAAVKLGRSFIGIEKDENYFKIASERINKVIEKE